ncbi:MAG: hypothetical protein AAGF23_07810 [Acidobacteriota bacterium]
MRFSIPCGVVPALASLVALVAIPAPAAFGEALAPAGTEIAVNTYTIGQQGFPEVAARPDGGFVVTWEGNGNQDGDSWGVFRQVFEADGSPSGGELQVNTTTAGTQWDPSVGVDAAGNFVIAWHGDGGGQDFDVFAQRFGADGMPVGGELQVNTETSGYQGNTTVAMSTAGDFLVVWESDGQDGDEAGVYGQLYDAAGATVGGEVRINDTTVGDQNDARVVSTDSGYAVTWESFLQDGSEEATILRFLDATAAPDGGEIVVNTEVLGDQEDAALAVDASGLIAVVWESTSQDGNGEGIFAQILDADGASVGPEFQVNAFTTGDQKNPRVAADGAGGFVAVWTSEDQFDDVSEEIYGRRLSADGAVIGDEFRVNTETSDDQDIPAISGGPGQQVLVTWRSFGAQDGSGAGVFAQRFQIVLFADGFESGDVSAWSSVVQ